MYRLDIIHICLDHLLFDFDQVYTVNMLPDQYYFVKTLLDSQDKYLHLLRNHLHFDLVEKYQYRICRNYSFLLDFAWYLEYMEGNMLDQQYLVQIRLGSFCNHFPKQLLQKMKIYLLDKQDI